jgi:penicillin-binding protein 1A
MQEGDAGCSQPPNPLAVIASVFDRMFAFRKGRIARAFGTLFSLGLTVCGALALYALYLAADLPELDDFNLNKAPASVIVLDRNGAEIGRRGGAGMREIALSQLPPHLPAAVLAIEDRRFYAHGGVDVRGTARAFLANLRAGDVVQGGSTLTQQLAKNLFLEPDRSLHRKGREAILAIWLEAEYDKHELLEAYLNRVYFGGGAWGVEAAAQRYFGKSARQVSVAEAAILAGLLKAPSHYSPVNDAERATSRARVVLDVMREAHAIDEATYQSARNARVTVLPRGQREVGGHFIDAVVEQAHGFARSGDETLYVTTTLDLGMQRAAEAQITRTLGTSPLEVSLVAIEGNGAVRALVGGRDYRISQFNRAMQARRQAGSLFKSYVYLAAVEAGVSPYDLRVDEPLELEGYAPRNFDRKFRGAIALNRAFADSVNLVAVRLAEEVGRERVANTAERLGFARRVRPHRSMALGTMDVRPLDVAAGYLPFANQGYRVEPLFITRVRNGKGEAVFEHVPAAPLAVIGDKPLRQMTELLAGVVEHGTGKRAALAGREAAGKTGTSDDSRDAWFAGFVPGLSAVVWVGHDDNRSDEALIGGLLPATIWREFMNAALIGQPVQPLYRESSATTTQDGLAMAQEPFPSADLTLEIGGDDIEFAQDTEPRAGISPSASVPGEPMNSLPTYNRGELDALIAAVATATEGEGLAMGGDEPEDGTLDADRRKLATISAFVSDH